MTTYKRVFSIFLLTIIAFTSAKAGNGINSPYSRYGLGILSNQSLGINRQMGGLGYGLRSNEYINILNPASFSQADTLTMLFEAGFSLQNTNFKEGKKRVFANNASFDYVAMQFRLCKGLGMSIGFLPYSNVGYSFSQSVDATTSQAHTDTYSGNGGIYQPYIGIGWQPFALLDIPALSNLSIGITGAYLYGDIDHIIAYDFTNSTDVTRIYNVSVRNYKVDFGLQYRINFNKKNSITLGGTYSLGHDLAAKTTRRNITESSDSTQNTHNGFYLPNTYGGGFVYNYNDQWKFGADYTYEEWNSSTFIDGEGKGVNRSKVSIGIEYTPVELSNNILKMISYRGGVHYAQPYTTIKNGIGYNEYGICAGISMPFMNRNNKFSHAALHISGEYTHLRPNTTGMISENCIRLNIGITFNETWFAKMKVR